MSNIHVVAIITAKPGQREAVLDLFAKNAEKVRAGDGCISYEATVDAENAGRMQTEFGPDTFVVIEQWESMEALGAHAVAPYTKEFGAKTKDMVADRVIHVLSPA